MELVSKKDKTILFYINSINVGGAERVILQLAYRFSISGYRSILVTSFKGENEYQVPESVERVIIENEKKSYGKIKRNVTRIKALRSYIKEYKPQALITFMAEPNFRAVIAKKGLKIKNIISVRSDPNLEYKGNVSRFLARHLLKKSDGCVFQTDEQKQWFPKSLQEKSTVINNEVAGVFFETEYLGGKDVVTLGRLNTVKNHPLLIRAFDKIKDEFKDVNLRIYGIGDREESLNALIKQLKLGDRVFLMGRTKNSEEVLKEAGVFVLSSNAEGMPNALMEALTVGVPSISTDCPCGGPRMLIKDGENGVLVSVGDEEGLASALRKILSDKEFAKKLSLNAKISSKAFKPEVVFEKWKDYVEKVIGS